MKKLFCVFFLVFLVFCAFGSGAQSQKPQKAKMKPVLLVIDIQNEFLPYMSEQNKKLAMELINGAIWRFHENGFPVIRVYHTDPQAGPKPGTEAFEFPKSVIIRPDDPQIIKNYPNAFKKTGLEKLLREKGCNTLFLCGLSSTGCVLATYHGAMDLDYDVFMIKHALIGPDSGLTRAVEEICETVSYGAVALMLENAQK
jgi:nicotinamidase-related amidase